MTGEPEPPVQLLLEDFLHYRLNVAAAKVSEGLARVYSSRFGLDIPGWRVIATLGQFGRATAKAIGEHSQMHKTKVSRALMQLQARGLVERSPNPQDKREAFIALTPAGIAVYGEIVPLALAYQTDLLAALDEPQRRQLDMIIDRLTEEALKLHRI
ncbi:MAG: MarR family winged helix-turn-helix transcriptional regulator [Pirellula sp.]